MQLCSNNSGISTINFTDDFASYWPLKTTDRHWSQCHFSLPSSRLRWPSNLKVLSKYSLRCAVEALSQSDTAYSKHVNEMKMDFNTSPLFVGISVDVLKEICFKYLFLTVVSYVLIWKLLDVCISSSEVPSNVVMEFITQESTFKICWWDYYLYKKKKRERKQIYHLMQRKLEPVNGNQFMLLEKVWKSLEVIKAACSHGNLPRDLLQSTSR